MYLYDIFLPTEDVRPGGNVVLNIVFREGSHSHCEVWNSSGS
jgi:hypothetical protein